MSHMGVVTRTMQLRLINSILCFVFLWFLSTSTGCIGDRGPRITYHNKTDTAIWVKVEGGIPKDFSGHFEADPRITSQGPIEAGHSRSFVYFDIPLGKSLGERLGNWGITAVSVNGTIIYQRIFTWTELYDSGWTVVIEKPAGGP